MKNIYIYYIIIITKKIYKKNLLLAMFALNIYRVRPEKSNTDEVTCTQRNSVRIKVMGPCGIPYRRCPPWGGGNMLKGEKWWSVSTILTSLFIDKDAGHCATRQTKTLTITWSSKSLCPDYRFILFRSRGSSPNYKSFIYETSNVGQ